MTAKHPVYRIPSCLDLELFDRVAIFYCDAYYIWRATGGARQMSVRLRYPPPQNKSWEMRLHMRQRLQASMVYRFLHLQRYRRNVLQIQVIAGKSRI